MTRSPRTGYLLGLASAFAWAATSPGIKYLLDTYAMPSLTLAFWRDAFIAAVLGLALLGASKSAALHVGWRDMRTLALTGAISVGLYHALWVFSIVLNGAALAVVLIYTYPTFVTLGAWLLFGERITRRQLFALALAFVGCALLVRAYDPAVLRVSWLGTLVGLGTGLTHAGYVLASQRVVARHSPWVTLMFTMLFGALALLVLGLAVQGPRAMIEVGAGAAPWLILLALAIGPTLGGYALFTLSLQHIPGRVASLLVLVEAPLAALLAVLLLGEQLSAPQVLGIALVLSAAALPTIGAAPVPAQTKAAGQLTGWEKAEQEGIPPA
jgi:drug/metabolite transporter (DMT)-like permease